MSQPRLYRFPKVWLARVRDLANRIDERGDAKARLLLSVELGFTLMEELGFNDEPIGAAWVLLSGMPMHEPRLAHLDARQRHALANARQLLPYSSRSAWFAALRAYAKLPEHVRNYDVSGDLEKRILAAARCERQPANRAACLDALAARLEFAARERQRAKADRGYSFIAPAGYGGNSESVTLRVRFDSDQAAVEEPSAWFDGPKDPRLPPLRVTREELRAAAAFLDAREAELIERYGRVVERGHWEARLNSLDYRPVVNGQPVKVDDALVEVAGFTNVAGMVASGKSTLAVLLTVHLLLTNPEARVALVEIGSAKGAHPEQSTRGAIREACAREDIASQLLRTVTGKAKDKDGQPTDNFRKKDVGRAHNAILDLVVRQPAVLLGEPGEVYARAGLPPELAGELDIVALYRRKVTEPNLHYALAVRLAADGQVDVRLPGRDAWIPYLDAGPALGRVIAEGRGQLYSNARSSRLNLSAAELADFAARIITESSERPTLIVLEADGWRNSGINGSTWPQLKNDRLWREQDTLDFKHVPAVSKVLSRSDPRFDQLLGVVRLRRGLETPQYVTGRTSWHDHQDAPDLGALSGFYERAMSGVTHYYSVGRLPITQKDQNRPNTRILHKLDAWTNPKGVARYDVYGANFAYKHQQVVEMLPFFLDPRLDRDGALTVCRALHYLRVSPAWNGGNINLPYPLHLAETLLADQLCIAGVQD